MENSIGEKYQKLLELLPKQPRSYDVTENPGLWTNGDSILCPSEQDKEAVESFLNVLFDGEATLLSGYYDPYEDAENGEQDECTGFCYVEIE